MSVLHPKVATHDAEPADGFCIICRKQLPKTGLSAAALIFDATGQPRGWACPAHVAELPQAIRKQIGKCMCARCGLSMVDEHGFTQGYAWCRDGGEFVLADPPAEVTALEKPEAVGLAAVA